MYLVRPAGGVLCARAWKGFRRLCSHAQFRPAADVLPFFGQTTMGVLPPMECCQGVQASGRSWKVQAPAQQRLIRERS